MPPIRLKPDADESLIEVELANSDLNLDLTSDEWNLSVKWASRIIGRDVIHRGRIAREGGRRQILASGLDLEGTALTGAWGVDFYGITSARFHDVFMDSDNYVTGGNALQKLQAPYAWPREMIDAYVTFDGDGREGVTQTRRITGIATVAEDDDQLTFGPNLSYALANYHIGSGIVPKISILYPKRFDKRGIWATNGRKFWLLHGGLWQLYIDLGTDDALGAEWDCAQISTRLLMFVSPDWPTRIVRLSDEPLGDSEVSDDASLAGLLIPKKPDNAETSGDDDTLWNKSWLGTVTGGGSGSLSAGDYKIQIRGVNIDDDAESRFVNVYDSTDADDRDMTAVATNSIQVEETVLHDNAAAASHHTPPPFHQRWTHLEVWRTKVNASTFYLERSIEVAAARQEHRVVASGSKFPRSIARGPSAMGSACRMSDASLGAQTIKLTADTLSGHHPPMCRKVASLQGVTICAGAASEVRNDPTVYSRNFYTRPADTTYTHATLRLAAAADQTWDYYIFAAGDELVITASDEDVTGTYAISSRVSNTTIELDSPGPGENLTNVEAYIRRSYTVPWPYIRSDEQIYHSRADKFAPESFLASPIRLSNRGDVLMGLAEVGDYVAAIMRDGVHLLRYDATAGTVEVDAISEHGQGTPWEHSIAVHADMVFWATSQGPLVMRVSPDADDEGRRAQITSLDPEGRVAAWFEEAEANGWPVDAGVDILNKCIRWRRQEDEHTYQAIQFCWTTNLWTLLDDDNGIRYASTTCAERSDYECVSGDYDDTGNAEGEHAVIKDDTGVTESDPWHGYTFNRGDLLRVTSPAALAGEYLIAGLGPKKPSSVLLLGKSIGADVGNSVDAYVVPVRQTAALYSVDSLGHVFLVNHYGIEHPYDGRCLQDTIVLSAGPTLAVIKDDDDILVSSQVGPDYAMTVSGIGAMTSWFDQSWDGAYIWITGGANTDEYRKLSWYRGATAYFDSDLPNTPQAGDTFVILRVIRHEITDNANTFPVGDYTAGDVIRFRSDTAAVDGVVRFLKDDSYHRKLIFDYVEGLAIGDEFIIGTPHFLIRFAPYLGQRRSSVKALDGVQVVALPGPRNNENDDWPSPPEGTIATRLYREHGDVIPDETAEEEGHIRVFGDQDVDLQTVDRVSSIVGDGTSLTLEIECVDSRTDFRLQSVQMRVRDSSDEVADASEDA